MFVHLCPFLMGQLLARVSVLDSLALAGTLGLNFGDETSPHNHLGFEIANATCLHTSPVAPS